MNLNPFGPNETNVSTAMGKKLSFWVASHMCHFAGKVARKISSNLFLKKKEKLLNSNGNMFNSTKSWTALRDKWSQLRPPLDITMISKGNTYFELKNSPFFNALEGFRPCLFVNLLFLYVILFLEASEGFLKLAKKLSFTCKIATGSILPFILVYVTLDLNNFVRSLVRKPGRITEVNVLPWSNLARWKHVDEIRSFCLFRSWQKVFFHLVCLLNTWVESTLRTNYFIL